MTNTIKIKNFGYIEGYGYDEKYYDISITVTPKKKEDLDDETVADIAYKAIEDTAEPENLYDAFSPYGPDDPEYGGRVYMYEGVWIYPDGSMEDESEDK
jgi:hypothetical protein